MTRPAAPAPEEVSALIAWMRALSDAGIGQADPAELTAFQQAKKDLLARIEHHHRHAPEEEGETR